ncbi:MAG TPA: acetyltransferase [Noviherbaspirillum sp.]|nr:acetyltransferase [Noviherbaspirillum sp.]
MGIRQGLVIFGFGGHARSVADIALATGYKEFLFIDDNARAGETFLGHPVLRQLPGAFPEGWSCFAASGDNRTRARQIASILESGWPLVTLIAPTASIGAGAAIGTGSIVAHHAHVGPMAKVGSGAIINTGAIVEHECIVGDFVHVSVNATAAGRSSLGDFVFLGASATVIDGTSVGREIIVGAGSLVVRDLEAPGTYIGVPAKRLMKEGAHEQQ